MPYITCYKSLNNEMTISLKPQLGCLHQLYEGTYHETFNFNDGLNSINFL
jgi:hypothetical protein